MNNLKLQLQKQLIANVIRDRCSKNKNIIFNEAWCEQDRITRFTTPFFKTLFQTPDNKGYWKTGDIAMYEVYIAPNYFSIACLVSEKNVRKEGKAIIERLFKYDTFRDVSSELYSLKEWKFTEEDSLDNLFLAFDDFLKNELISFENNIADFIDEAKHKDTLYTEGEQEVFFGSKYERNPKARAACLAYHGTSCVVCGIDFEKAYGPEFAGKIEVHHIVPLSQNGEEYIVDPVRDLVPVCPNCHTAIHSKKDGVYTVEEMKRLRNKQQDLDCKK